MGSALELLDGGGKRKFVTPGHLPDAGGDLGNGKDCAPPSSEGVGSEVGEPRNLFPRLGVG